MAAIVLIDDDHGPIDLYVRALREHGHEVRHLDTLAKAFIHIREVDSPPDLYILDMMMSLGTETAEWPDDFNEKEAGYGMTSGLAIYQRIRRRFARAPIILLTSVAEPEILERLPMDEACIAEFKIRTKPSRLVELVTEHLTHNVRHA